MAKPFDSAEKGSLPQGRRVALVTGANRGIGYEIARGLGRAGLIVLLTAREKDDARAAAEQLSDERLTVRPFQLDVTDGKSVDRLMKSVARAPGRLDVLVNNAGIAIDTRSTASDIDLDKARQTFETNFFGAWRMAIAALPLMRKNGYGRIVNLSSGMGAITEGLGQDWPAYRTSKTAINALTRVLAAELAGTNILVNSACPGWVRTKMGGPAAPGTPEEGADTPVWLATLPDGGPTGGFFRARKPAAW